MHTAWLYKDKKEIPFRAYRQEKEAAAIRKEKEKKMRAQWGIINSGNDNLTWTAYQQVGQRSQKHEDQSTEQADGSWPKRNNTESNDPYQ